MIPAIISALSPVASLLQVILLQAFMPIVTAAIAAGLSAITVQAARVIGQKNAQQLRDQIAKAITNGLIAAASPNTPGTPTFEQAVQQAVEHAKAAYPDAIRKLGAADGPLAILATTALAQLIQQGLAKVQTTK
jgi:hypothetical protein